MGVVFLDLKLGTVAFYQFYVFFSWPTFPDFLPTILKCHFIIIFPCSAYDNTGKKEKYSRMNQSLCRNAHFHLLLILETPVVAQVQKGVPWKSSTIFEVQIHSLRCFPVSE